jgi:hypothetical protein
VLDDRPVLVLRPRDFLIDDRTDKMCVLDEGRADRRSTADLGRREEVRLSLVETIALILEDHREDGLRGVPPAAERETVTVK